MKISDSAKEWTAGGLVILGFGAAPGIFVAEELTDSPTTQRFTTAGGTTFTIDTGKYALFDDVVVSGMGPGPDRRSVRVMAADSYTLKPIGHRGLKGRWVVPDATHPDLQNSVVLSTCEGGTPEWLTFTFNPEKDEWTLAPDAPVSRALTVSQLDRAGLKTTVPAVETACRGAEMT